MTDSIRDVVRRSLITTSRVSGLASAISAGAAWAPSRKVADEPVAVRLRAPGRTEPVAIVAHFDPRPEVSDAFVALCRGLSDAGLRVMVVSTSAAQPQDIIGPLEPVADIVMTRRNVGFDFKSWQRGLEHLWNNDHRPHHLVLTNGSMYGPLWSIDDLITNMAEVPIWGMTESLDFRRHLQSWWLGFSGATAASPAFASYWSTIRPATNKWSTITAHELRWSRVLSPRGTHPVAIAPVERHGCRRNPLFFAWRELIANCGVPFVKRSLFTHNYDRVDMTGWRGFLSEAAPDFDVDLILRDLPESALTTEPRT